ncbi:ABC transporter ATP-binding protein [Salinibacillus xinjiangensis]|uniref:ATP-binding cassette domain-containing protein n=1 Tax=Salinibacillus xinjiangensis TaxID=1229268 RepID=A0A6G1X5N2_9BACI|nr:ABC transporter ATP-binding protein [Salinibacillus xinjiangensis]MRG86128.1 ATP-binding cassette domain-containing protein [Salinibacillus xinjiangensis]
MLAVNEITKQYGEKVVLKNVNLTFEKGTCYGLVGPNGAGKFTLMKIIVSIITDYKGSVDSSLSTTSLKEQIGYIPQDICMEEKRTANSNLQLFGKLYGLKGKVLEQRLKEALTLIGLKNHGQEKVQTFSGGMKRRLNIGCALMHRPSIVVMDEPTVGIDPQSRQQIYNIVDDLKQKGCTIIYASHYMEEVERLCDYVAMMVHGTIIEEGEIGEVLQKYTQPSVYVEGEFNENEFGTLGTFIPKNAGYLMQTSEPLKTMEKLIQYCKRNSIGVNRLELARPRLEDVFFSMIGSQLRD